MEKISMGHTKQDFIKGIFTMTQTFTKIYSRWIKDKSDNLQCGFSRSHNIHGFNNYLNFWSIVNSFQQSFSCDDLNFKMTRKGTWYNPMH